MSTSSLSEWPLFPLKVLKTFATSRRNSFDGGQQIMKEINYKDEASDNNPDLELKTENPTKKSYFEITSIEEHDQEDQPKLDPNNTKTVYMVKINSFKRGRWAVTDSQAPETNLDKCVKSGQSVEFIDKETGDQWLFSDSTTNQNTNPVVEPSAPTEIQPEISTGTGHIPGTRFIVRSIITSKNGNIIKCDSMPSGTSNESKSIPSNVQSKNSTRAGSPQENPQNSTATVDPNINNFNPILPPKNANNPENKPNQYYTLDSVHGDLSNLSLSARAKAQSPPIISIVQNTNKKSNDHTIVSNANQPSDRFEHIVNPSTNNNCNPNPQKSNENIYSSGHSLIDFDSYPKPQQTNQNIKYYTPNSAIPSHENGLCCCTVQQIANLPTNNYCTTPCDTFNKSLDKITRVHNTTLQSLTGQLSILNDHIVELNHVIYQIQGENERLKHDRLHLHALLEHRSQPLAPEIIRCGNDESVFMLVEIIPGGKRLLNITKFLTPEELNYINLIKK